ncbi:family 65 glycosyl hydrolase [Enterococcus sp. BWM-S5]|uniref:Family 65 glycosyl hydrolase n=1 Tax=Enterococcus larvae TaxID=2794352 RepID=A0ABS4CH11_9ENTE|nr:glycosyl hydrolase family 65 protein [Enterococcus larvae]MBP1045247.1 family 65 glycosyl hydrolase [Enterococcus larvae]
MAKAADDYFKLDPWKIIEEGFDPEYERVTESIFSLGNEYMGIRGYFEEGTSGDSLLGSYFNGIYEFSRKEALSHYKGIVTKPHFMLNAVNWLDTEIRLEDETLDMNRVHLDDFYRELDLKTGVLTRSFIWKTKTGKQLKVRFERFLHMEKSSNGYQQLSFEPLNFSGDIHVSMGIDFNTKHGEEPISFWKEQEKGTLNDQGDLAIIGQTLTTKQQIFSGFHLEINQAYEKKKIEAEKKISYSLTIPLTKNEETIVKKLVVNVIKKQEVSKDVMWQEGSTALADSVKLGYEQAKKDQKDYWTYIWDHFDIQIDGDEKNQQGIRFCIFQLQQTYHGQNPSNNIGAKGLTGEAYSGHAFWDTETCCLPYYLFNNPKAAKNLLEFRYSTLDAARKRARDLDCTGACYPIATLNGEEACDLWQHASTQFQPSTGVAYGIWHYVHLTEDQDFLYDHGVEMLVEISRFLESRGDWSQLTKKFGFYGVMGPDEFQVMVNHNAYTNYMAQQTFDFTIQVLEEMSVEAPGQLKQLLTKTNLTEEEWRQWQHSAEETLFFESEDGVIEQHEGYFDLPHIDIDQIPISDFPLYSHWSYDRIYRNDMIKQPDVLMFQFLYNQRFSEESKRVNYDYYEPRTIHESSLSPSIHSVLAAELGKFDEAFDFFSFATRMDLDNYNRNTNEGLHTTSIAAAWMNIVYGFGGLRSDGSQLILSPVVPKQWDGYSFRIEYRNRIVEVKVTRSTAKISIVKGESILLSVYGEERLIDAEGTELAIPKEKLQQV